jgi:hypothetical protein
MKFLRMWDGSNRDSPQHMLGRTEEVTEYLIIAGLMAEIRTRKIPNGKQMYSLQGETFNTLIVNEDI